MGIAHGFASTVVLRAESPVYAGGFRQSNAFWGGLSVFNRSLECVSSGVALILTHISVYDGLSSEVPRKRRVKEDVYQGGWASRPPANEAR
jgi:hypothetical protein